MNKHLQSSLSQSGFSILEIILSATIFLLFSTGVVFLVLQSLAVERESAEYLSATSYAHEGMESVNFIRQAGYSSLGTLSDGDIERHDEEGLRFFYGTNTFGIYERKISVTDLDPVSKRVEVTVSWPVGSPTQRSLTLTGYLFYWQQSY